MKQRRLKEVIFETRSGPKSYFVVEEKRWWGWQDISTIDGYTLANTTEVEEFLRVRDTNTRVIIRPL